LEIKITGKNLDVADELELFAEKKLNKLEKYSTRLQSATVNFTEQVSKNRNKSHRAEILIHLPGTVLSAREDAESFYIAIDGAMDKVVRQLKKEKTKRQDKPRIKPSKAGLESLPESPVAEPALPHNVSVKYLDPMPKTVEDAILALEESGNAFYMFVSEDATVNCLYKRDSGGYGLLVREPGT